MTRPVAPEQVPPAVHGAANAVFDLRDADSELLELVDDRLLPYAWQGGVRVRRLVAHGQSCRLQLQVLHVDGSLAVDVHLAPAAPRLVALLTPGAAPAWVPCQTQVRLAPVPAGPASLVVRDPRAPDRTARTPWVCL
jgi:hypothetical protein